MSHLFPDLAEKRVVARIDRARAHHVVPDHDSKLVARVVEDILFVLAAAPKTNHVHVRGLRALKKIAVARRSLLVFVCGAGNPVRALHENPPTVDAEDERKLLLALRVYGPLVQDLDFPETNLLDDLLAIYIELGGVELLLASAIRPPKRRVVYLELLLGLRAVGELRRDRKSAVSEVVVEVLGRVDVFDTRPVCRDQLGSAAEAGDLHGGTPVPAGVTRGLAHKRLVLRPHYIGHRELAAFRGTALVGLVLGAPEFAFDRVLAFLQERLHVKGVALEAVRRFADLLSVHENRCETVAVLEPKDDLLLREEVRRHVELARDVPVALPDPLHVLLVLAPERILHKARLQERSMHASRNGYGAGDLCVVCLDEFPCSGEIELGGESDGRNDRRNKRE